MEAYLDNNATTRPADAVVDAVTETLRNDWANPSSVHRFGQRARHRVELAREQVCTLLGCRPRELIFTSGATESNNLALHGFRLARQQCRTIITTALEHSAVREPCQHLADSGYRIINLKVDIDGLVSVSDLQAALRQHGNDTALVAIHWINNETGAIQPVEEIGGLCRTHAVPFFTDATQAVGKIPIHLDQIPVDALSFSGHKMHGPKGIGGLFLRTRSRLVPQVLGGPQERDRRGGTENVPGIVGLGVAADLAGQCLAGDGPARIEQLRRRLEQGIIEAVPDAQVISANAPRIWNTTNIGFPPLESEAILLLLSEKGLCAAAGAACSSGSLEPSPVLLAQGVAETVAHGAIRFSLSRETRDQEIDYTLDIIPQVIEKLRASLPAGPKA
ncbi:MAG: cysteine desulfurase [Phycisphaerae bacterium]|nr:cysteine desulfurase [Phycisphaerae bacterium]